MTALELRFVLGRRAGEAVALAPGDRLEVGTGRGCAVQVREAGVAFRHAVVHVAASLPDGRPDAVAVEVEDLGRGATFVNDEAVAPRSRRTLARGDRLRLGDEVALVLDEPLPVDPRATLAAIAALPPFRDLADLWALAEEAVPVGALEAPAPGAGGLAPLEREEAALAARDLQALVGPGWLPPDPADWLRRTADGDWVALRETPRGRLAARRWEVLALLPPGAAPGAGAARLTDAVAAVLEGARDLAPRVLEPHEGGLWSCRFEQGARRLLGRFARIDAASDGVVLALTFAPDLEGRLAEARASAEDLVAEALQAQARTRRYRPPALGPAPAAKPLPPGGRFGRLRHKPTRTKPER